MRDNWGISLHSNRLVLLPYRKRNVAKYHEWMQSPFLLEATASEPLSLQEEYAMQRQWRDDPKKCTFIVHVVLDDGSLCMIGDTNFFFNDADDPLCVEIEIMIAETTYQRMGFATTSLQMMMAYGRQKLGIERFVAKIGYANAASLAMFTSAKLGYTVFEKHDWCEENHCVLDLRATGTGTATGAGTATATATGADLVVKLERMDRWSTLTRMQSNAPPLDEEYNLPHCAWSLSWFNTNVQQWLGLSNHAALFALGLTNRALYGLFSLRPQTKTNQSWGPLLRPTILSQANVTQHSTQHVHGGGGKLNRSADSEKSEEDSEDSEESIPNKNFSGIALFDTDSMFWVDLAGGELKFNGTSIYCRNDTKGNNDKDDTGHITWDGAIVMAKWLEKHSVVCKGKNVLELGAGTGFVGLSTIPCGAHHVFLTDLDYALHVATLNVNKNVLMQSIAQQHVTVRALDWYDTDLQQFTDQELKTVDVLVAADVVWQKVLVVPLAETIVRLLQRIKPNGAAYLLYTSRYGKEFDAFVVACFQDNGLVLAVQPYDDFCETYRYEDAAVWKISLAQYKR